MGKPRQTFGDQVALYNSMSAFMNASGEHQQLCLSGEIQPKSLYRTNSDGSSFPMPLVDTPYPMGMTFSDWYSYENVESLHYNDFAGTTQVSQSGAAPVSEVGPAPDASESMSTSICQDYMMTESGNIPVPTNVRSDAMDVDSAAVVASLLTSSTTLPANSYGMDERVHLCNEITALACEHQQNILSIVFREERHNVRQALDGSMNFSLYDLLPSTIQKIHEYVLSINFVAPASLHTSTQLQLMGQVKEEPPAEAEIAEFTPVQPTHGYSDAMYTLNAPQQPAQKTATRASKRKAESEELAPLAKRRRVRSTFDSSAWVSEDSQTDPELDGEEGSSSDGDYSADASPRSSSSSSRRARAQAQAQAQSEQQTINGNGKFMLTVEIYDLRETKAENGEFTCPKCPHTFSDSSNLTKHLRTHTEERPYACDICGKSFTHSSTLKDHLNIHSGARPYACSHPNCLKTFSNGSNLNRHMRTHTGEKPYKCTVCKKAFSQSSNLKVHMKTHDRV